MTTSPNALYTHVEQSQANKEASINLIADRADVSQNDPVDIVCTAGGTIQITSAQKLDNRHFRMTGTPAGAFTLEFPDGDREVTLSNVSGQTATIETATGASSPPTVIDTAKSLIQILGTDIDTIAEAATSAFGLKTEYIPAEAWQPSVTNPCGAVVNREFTAANPNVTIRGFDSGATIEEARKSFPFPPRFNNSTVTFRARYTHTGAHTGGLDGVAWGLSAVAVDDDGAIDVAFGTEIIVTLDRANADDVHWTAVSAALTIAGTPADGKQVFWKLRRVTSDGADDLDTDADLIGVEIRWTEDAVVDT